MRLWMSCYRGAVRPPFIEADSVPKGSALAASYRGAVRPPFIEADAVVAVTTIPSLSGGSPPPLH